LKSYPVNTLKENRSFKGASQKGFLSKSPHGEKKRPAHARTSIHDLRVAPARWTIGQSSL
jgi:hypothetical protein